MVNKDIYRIIDANFNRSREGLRVCEEVSRFIWNSRQLTKDLKSVRHAVTDTIKNSKATAKILCLARNTDADVGRCLRTASEMRKSGESDIFYANMERAKESIRVLEEFFKLIDKKVSVKFTTLRFKLYDIEKRARK